MSVLRLRRRLRQLLLLALIERRQRFINKLYASWERRRCGLSPFPLVDPYFKKGKNS